MANRGNRVDFYVCSNQYGCTEMHENDAEVCPVMNYCYKCDKELPEKPFWGAEDDYDYWYDEYYCGPQCKEPWQLTWKEKFILAIDKRRGLN